MMIFSYEQFEQIDFPVRKLFVIGRWSIIILTHMRTMVLEYESQHLPLVQNHPVM